MGLKTYGQGQTEIEQFIPHLTRCLLECEHLCDSPVPYIILRVFILVLHSSPWLKRYPFFASYLVLTSRMLSRIEEAHRGSVRWKQSGKSCSVQTIRLNTDPFVHHIHQHTSHSTLSPLNVGENTQVPSLITVFQYYRGRIGRPAWFARILLPWCAWTPCVPCTPSDRLWVSCIKYILFYLIVSLASFQLLY